MKKPNSIGVKPVSFLHIASVAMASLLLASCNLTTVQNGMFSPNDGSGHQSQQTNPWALPDPSPTPVADPYPSPSTSPQPSPAPSTSPTSSPTPSPSSSPSASPTPTVTLSPAPSTNPYLADPAQSGRVLTVCPSGCDYTMPSQALDAGSGVLQDGDVVEIKGGNYVDCMVIKNNNITIRGISVNGIRPHIHDKVCGRKGIIVVMGNHVLIDNLELSGARDTGYGDYNWSGVRMDFGTGNNMTIRNSYIHDCDDGVLGGGGVDGVQLIDSTHFAHNGRNGFAHEMYINTMAHFILRNSVVESNQYDGHLVKSRALNSIIECNTLAGLNGLNTDAIDIPQGGDTTIRQNVIESGPNNTNPRTMIAYAEEPEINPVMKLSVYNNYLIDDTPLHSFFWIMRSPTLTGWANNILVGSEGVTYTGSSETVTSGFTQYTNRTAAGLSSYDGTLNSLPAAPHCN